MKIDDAVVEEHLRAASDAILLLLGEVGQLEGHKRGVLPADPRFEELARGVRSAAEALAEFARQEEDWARKTSQTDAPVATISSTQAAPSLGVILERWRGIERQLND